MSVCMSLFKPITGVKYNGYPEDMNIQPSCENKMFGEYWDELQKKQWSDGKVHSVFNLTHYLYMDKRVSRKYRRKFKDIPWINYTFKDTGCTEKFIPVETIEYAQGWFFRNSFLNRKNSFYHSVSKRGMVDFFKKYVVIKDKETADILKRFEDAWEDGMVFECSF